MSEADRRITFDEKQKVFRIRGLSTLYSFRIDPKGLLESLYWGKNLPDSDDLRIYLISNPLLPFDPKVDGSGFSDTVGVFLTDMKDPCKGLLSDTDEQLQGKWRAFRDTHKGDGSAEDKLHGRRMENLSWRFAC